MNCSQKLISLIFGTTGLSSVTRCSPLWIALKSWYLWYSEQPTGEKQEGIRCCELLSKVDIFDIRNNLQIQGSLAKRVVNCSQKLISLIFGTTRTYLSWKKVRLWIALKSWYLWYSEQQGQEVTLSFRVVNCSQKLISLIFGTTIDSLADGDVSCELLSKVDIFDIRNNIK